MVVYILQIFIRSTYIQNLKYNVKTVCIFHLILVDILSILLLSVKNRGVVVGGGGLLNGQNPLSVTKVICRQSLSHALDFGPGLSRNGFECSESIRKRKICDQNSLFQIILNKVLIMIAADV